jgi:aspartate carbamoyltransferase catalytic subunit
MQNLLTLNGISGDAIKEILKLAVSNKFQDDSLQGCVLANLFFEPSTRTCLSFELAAKKMGATVLSPNLQFSALQKGESLFDTVKTVVALGAHIIVMRHGQTGVVDELARNFPDTSFINAGDGMGQHPTQALADILTIMQDKAFGGNFNLPALNVSIVGDSKHSRVANSLVSALKALGCSDIRLIGPAQMLAKHNDVVNVNSMQGVKGSDVVVTLRAQKERWSEEFKRTLADDDYDFILTADQMQYAADKAIILHPGPVIGESEISYKLQNSVQCLVSEQVRNGVLVRQAVLYSLWQNIVLSKQKIPASLA